MDKPVAPGEGIIHHAEDVNLLPANMELSGLEVTLVNTMNRETVLLSIWAAEINEEGRSIYLHDPAGKVSAAYAAPTREVCHEN